MIRLSVTRSGGLFDGRAERSVGEFLEDAQREVGAQASSEVHLILDRRIKKPTPYYETQIVTERQANDVVVHDRGIKYGPWLEGVGSRNYPVTRFKGYHAFRLATLAMNGKVGGLVREVAGRYFPQ